MSDVLVLVVLHLLALMCHVFALIAQPKESGLHGLHVLRPIALVGLNIAHGKWIDLLHAMARVTLTAHLHNNKTASRNAAPATKIPLAPAIVYWRRPGASGATVR